MLSALITVSSVLIVSAAATPLMSFFFKIGNIKPKLFFYFLIQRSTLTKPLPPSFHFMYNLSTLLLGCNASYIVIVFRDFQPTSFISLSFHSIISALYLNKATVHAFIGVFCFSYLVLVLGPMKAFAYIPLLFLLSFHSLRPYSV